MARWSVHNRTKSRVLPLVWSNISFFSQKATSSNRRILSYIKHRVPGRMTWQASWRWICLEICPHCLKRSSCIRPCKYRAIFGHLKVPLGLGIESSFYWQNYCAILTCTVAQDPADLSGVWTWLSANSPLSFLFAGFFTVMLSLRLLKVFTHEVLMYFEDCLWITMVRR